MVLLVLAAALVRAQGAAAQEAAPSSAQRGFESVTPDQTVKNGHQYVVAIGIDHYDELADPEHGGQRRDGVCQAADQQIRV